MPFTTADPFRPIDMTIEYVDSVAGSRKTTNAVNDAIVSASQHGTRTIFAMPTLALVKEWVNKARGYTRAVDNAVEIYEITTTTGSPVAASIIKHITKETDGHLLFITHEGFHRVPVWPSETSGFDLYIDEVMDAVLSRKPFKLRDSHWVLTSFIDVVPVPTTIAERKNFPSNVVSLKDWAEEKSEDKSELLYNQIVPKLSSKAQDPMFWVKRRDFAKRQDDIYEYLDPIPRWIIQGNPLFTDKDKWEQMIMKRPEEPENLLGNLDPEYTALRHRYNDPTKGLITITGFRRPDVLKSFGRVTIMSALFTHTLLHDVWQTLGVKFIPSQTIPLSQKTTDLGKRRLRIYWLTDEGWSKKVRDKSGGIEKILQLINDSGVIKNQHLCVIINKDDGSPQNQEVVKKVFPKGVVLPHNVRGQNTWINSHQMIHGAALNSYTSDIHWMESVLGIDSNKLRIGRTGQEVYQSLMRLSLREPTAKQDITLVVMDKDVAEWLPQWFTGKVEVLQIDSTGVIRKKEKRGRKPVTGKTLSNTERTRRRRERLAKADLEC